ncbi:restriction endonuclease subunit S [Brachybacterium hainanense]|uniref:Restriction endonuclease subunit S n=1 Tax=Brachybacterium hainanense TaxID=1541174 RepID=A0ABV6R9C7_9MICO
MSDFLALPLHIPSIEEQRRIASILDEVDAIRAKRRAQLAHLDELPQALFHETFGLPSDYWATLSDFCNFYSGGTPSKSKSDYWEGSLPWFSAKDLKSANLIDSVDHVSERVPTETRLRTLPQNTIVLVVRGMILAHTVPVSVLRVSGLINQDLKALIPRVDIDTDFLAEAVRARESWLLGQVSAAAHGTTKLDSSILGVLPVPRIPFRDQQEFAEKIAVVRAEHDRVARALQADDELFAALQYRAFRGEL